MSASRKREGRRNEILDIAETLFATKGYDKTTINDILDGAGIGKGTLYHYYNSKEEIMDAIITRIVDAGIDAAQAIVSDATLTAPQKIFAMITAQGPSKQKHEITQQLHEPENAQMHQRSLVETVVRLTPHISAVIEDGISKGMFRTPYPREVVEAMLVATLFVLDEGMFPCSPQEMGRKAVAFAWMIETLLGAQPGTFLFVKDMIIQQTNHEHGEHNNG